MFLLSDLVRATFIASTSYSDQLRREGLSALQMIINVFCDTLDPDYDNHALLEQYQAQVGAALRPAFEDDTPPDVTSMACQVPFFVKIVTLLDLFWIVTHLPPYSGLSWL